MSFWLGVDVGAPRKGFDAALVDAQGVVGLKRGLDVAAVTRLVEARAPAVVGIDSPGSPAPDGETSRAGERAVARAVCGIRWTPDAAALTANPHYYGWVLEGLRLHEALTEADTTVIEVFPTASWTRWHGPRGRQPRADWSREALGGLGLEGVPARTSQDQRDAIGAAVTARAFAAGRTESFGGIVVPAV